MSKRISNRRGQSRKTTARSKVNYGWRKLKLFGIHGKDKVLSGEYLNDQRSN
jgi:hypothetical protein